MKNIILSLFFCAISLSGSARAERIVGSTDIDVTIIYQSPTCNIKLPKEVLLGALSDGMKEHEEFMISVVCEEDAKVGITANVLSSDGLHSPDTIRMSNGSYLWLKENGVNIKFQGDDNDKSFCINDRLVAKKEHICKLTPVTEVRPGDARGKAESIVRFNVVFP